MLCNNIRNIGNTLVITGNFNIRNNDWDLSFHYYSTYSEDLFIIADSLGLELSPSTNPRPTRYTDNPCDTNSVLDLVFLALNN